MTAAMPATMMIVQRLRFEPPEPFCGAFFGGGGVFALSAIGDPRRRVPTHPSVRFAGLHRCDRSILAQCVLLATSVGDAIGARIAVYYDELGQQAFFGLLGVIALVAAIVVLAIAKPLGRLVPD